MAALLGGGPAPAGASEEIEELTVPDAVLETLEDTVQVQLRSERSAMEAVLANPGADPQARGAAYGRMGQLYLAYGLTTPAGACLVNADRLLKDDFRWPYYLGNLHVQEGHLAEARTEFERASSLAPRYVAGQVRLGRVQLELADLEAAEASFRRALVLAPESVGAYEGLGRLALQRQQADIAIESFKKALEIQPEAKSLHYELGMAYRQSGQVDLARQHLAEFEDKPVKLTDPVMGSLQALLQGPEIHFKRGLDALRDGDPRTAIRELEATIRLSPQDALAHYYLALAELRVWRSEQRPEQVERGLAELRHALEINPEYRDAHYVLGSMLGLLGELTEALHHFAEAHRIDPDYLDAHLEWAIALGKTGEEERALSEIRVVVETDPTFGRAQVALATLLAARGDHEEALDHYRQALQHEKAPDSELILAAATAAGRAGSFDEAATLFERLLAREPGREEPLVGRAMALILGGRLADAGEALATARRLAPDSLLMTDLSARFLATCPDDELRDGELALELALRVYRQRPGPAHAETVAMALAELGRFDEAVEWQGRAVEQLAGSEEAAARRRLQRYRSGETVRDLWEIGGRPATRP